MHTVVYDHQIFSYQRFGGVSRYFCEIASRIGRTQGWKTRVIAPLHLNRYLADSDIATFGLHLPLPVPKLEKIYGAFDDWAGRTLLAMYGADILHQTYYSGAPTGRGRLVVTVFDMIHELLPRYFSADDPIPARKRQAVQAADHVVCISHKTAADLVEILGVPTSKITVTPLGFSDVFQESRLDVTPAAGLSGRPYLLYVGHRAGYKNFSRVLDAFAASTRMSDSVDLVAFGGPAFTPAEQARIASLALRPGAVRQQFGDDPALARCYAGARAFVYPSEYEGFGIPPLEAMSCGCPVACSSASAIPEVVGTAGEYFEPTDVDSIRHAMERLIFDDQRRTELSVAGRAQCRLFSWDDCAARTLAAYEITLGAAASPS